jgi:hypothetical protein
MSGARGIFATTAVLAALLGCSGPEAPAHPTWVDVHPILAGQCTHCHGATATITGAGFRFDFYDMKEATCQEATAALGEDAPLGFARSADIWDAITSDRPDQRPSMPPEPAPYLAKWEWQTIQRWLDDGAPRGDTPASNRAPHIQQLFGLTAVADEGMDLTIVVDDADADPVVGLLQVDDGKLHDGYRPFDYAGAFSTHIDTSTWPAGEHSVTAVLCDGWVAAAYPLGSVTIDHGGQTVADR